MSSHPGNTLQDKAKSAENVLQLTHCKATYFSTMYAGLSTTTREWSACNCTVPRTPWRVCRLLHSILAVDIVFALSLAFCTIIVCLTANGSNWLPEICQHLTKKPAVSSDTGIDQHRRTQARQRTCARYHMRLAPTVADPVPSKSLRGKELLATKFRWRATGTAETARHA